MLANLKLWLYAGAAGVVLAAFLWFAAHERAVGRQHELDAVNKATRAAQLAAQKETDEWKAKAAAAAQESADARKRYDDFVAAQPLGPVWLCKRSAPANGVPAAPGAVAGIEGTGAGPDPGAAVPAGVDVGPDLEAIVLGFAALAIQVSEFQHR